MIPPLRGSSEMTHHEAKQRWQQQTYEPTKAKTPERQAKFETSSGIELDALYTPDEASQDVVQDLGFPGEYPYTRGVQPTMYRGKLWTMRQYAGYASAAE